MLFHGSQCKDLVTLEPRANRTRQNGDGSVIFATPDMGFASIFMCSHDDRWTMSGNFIFTRNDNVDNEKLGNIMYFLCKDRARFIKEDVGGAIYVLSSESFTCDENKGMGYLEWVARKPVMPLTKFVYNSTLHTMLDFGVQVFFVSEQEFERARHDVKAVLKHAVSENAARGYNVQEL